MSRKEEIEVQLSALMTELYAIEAKETEAKNAALRGKCFKFRNCYSCPKSDADYWWLYAKVIDVVDGGLRCLRFQTDSEGRIEIEPSRHSPGMSTYEEISEMEFSLAFDEVRRAIAGLAA